MLSILKLTPEQFDALAAGRGDAGVIAALQAGQRARRLLELVQLRKSVDSRRLANHFDLLRAAERASPAAAAATLAEPHVGAWLAHALRLVRGRAEPAYPMEVELDYLGGIAAAAAIRAELEFKVDLLARDGRVMLPGLGRLEAPGAGEISVVSDPHSCGGAWLPLRSLSTTVDDLTLALRVDDVDPLRGHHGHPPTDRLSSSDLAAWQALLDEAWPVLVRHHRSYAEAIAAGLTTLVPLQTVSQHRGVNVTSMAAFGSVSFTHPADGLALALGLVHEFQHAKLGALLDMIQLYERDDEPRFYAPWRDDPRPLGAALQGVYAFLGVTDFWRVQRTVLDDSRATAAEVEFVRWRDRVWRTHTDLMASGHYTRAGRRFMAGLLAVQESMLAEPADPLAVRMAAQAAQDHWVGWRLRNRHPAPAFVSQLAGAWIAGRPCGDVAVPVAIATDGRELLSHSARLDLARLRITDPDTFDAVRDDPSRLPPEAVPGDVALAAGDYAEATARYADDIRAGRGGLDAWIGLVLAAADTAVEPAELCMAVYQKLIADGVDADPVAVARWLAPARVAV